MASGDNFLAIFFGAFFGGSFLIIGIVFTLVYCLIWKPQLQRRRQQYHASQLDQVNRRPYVRQQALPVVRDYGVTPVMTIQPVQPIMEMPRVPDLQPSAPPAMNDQLPSYTELMGKSSV